MVRMLLLVVLLLQSWTAIWAYPDGAGSCIAGAAAVGGGHLELLYNGLPRAFGVISGSLVDGDVVVLLGGIPLDPVSPTIVAAGQNHTIRVVGTLYDGYKGLLIRMEDVTEGGDLDLTAALLPGLNTKSADVCIPPVVGVTHTDSAFKKECTATIRLDQAGDVILDITMVGINDAFATIYGYTRFNVTFVEAEVEETIATPVAVSRGSDGPSSTPSDIPSSSPSDVPSSSPTNDSVTADSLTIEPLSDVEEPIATPVAVSRASDGPSSTPSDAPSSIPSDIPSSIPSDFPSSIPSDAPSALPSDVPSSMPSDAPSSIPSDVPSSMPSDAPSALPSDVPSSMPSDAPSSIPSDVPSAMPSDLPSSSP